MQKDLKILLIEDNLIEIMKMKRTLSLLKSNHTIIEAKEGEEESDCGSQYDYYDHYAYRRLEKRPRPQTQA